MSEFSWLATGLEICLLPLVGLTLLVTSKVSVGLVGRGAQRLFLAVLVLATLATFRTLLAGQPHWLMHAVTMALMIVGSVWVPANRPCDGAWGLGMSVDRPVLH